MAGIDILAIQKALGHKTLAMTLRYAHLSPKHAVQAIGALDRVAPRPNEPVEAMVPATGQAPQPEATASGSSTAPAHGGPLTNTP